MPGVYISYPFCAQKCTFCNFASGVSKPGIRSLYEEALLTQLQTHAWKWTPETIYLGGGTPSLMPLNVLERLLRAVPSQNLVEVTLECAPGTITPDRVEKWAEYGINRISLGVQSFDRNELIHSGRRHDASVVERDLAMLRSAGISNINLDLIAGLPYQTRDSWTNSLDWIERLDAPHVSVYLFEIDEDSRLGHEVLAGGIRYGAGFLPSEDMAADFYQVAVDRLSRLQYDHYEISNFARAGFQSCHNVKYWLLESYVGFGLDAHSYDGRFRWGNPDSLEAYLASCRTTDLTGVGDEVDSGEEHFFVGLRLLAGIEPTPEEWSRFAIPIEKWTSLGMLERTEGTLRLSPKGVLVSNEIFQEFLHV